MNIEEIIKKLKNEFIRIKNMGYVKSNREGTTGIGKTFEDLLGKKEDSLTIPYYYGIEIKTKRGYSKSYTTLFCLTLKGEEKYQINRLKDIYGYPDKVIKNSKVLNNSVYANKATLIANRYLFKLDIDYNEEKIYLSILDKNLMFLEKKAYFEFSDIKKRLEEKLMFVAYVKGWPKKINDITYYKYTNMDLYKLKSFDKFLELLNEGVIRVNFKIGVYKSGENKGKIYDRGTSFDIQEKDLIKLFDKID